MVLLVFIDLSKIARYWWFGNSTYVFLRTVIIVTCN
jgi:hypothetical protein